MMDKYLPDAAMSAPAPKTSITENTAKVEVLDIKSFLENLGGTRIKLPDYQRPYVWNTEKVDILINDLTDFARQADASPFYYMGTLLFHISGENYNIIDGQQRLTTLMVLDYLINPGKGLISKYKENLQLAYNSPVSIENIGRNRDYLAKILNEGQHEELRQVMDRLIFTIITTSSADEAFTYFDSQNSRGVSLGAVDFLKAYHLRAMKGDVNQDQKQAQLATVWDRNNSGQFLEMLFSRYIWRIRKWKGKDIDFEDNEKILEEFQKETGQKSSSIKLYPGQHNRYLQSMNYIADGRVAFDALPAAGITHPIEYPFSIRQPIQQGDGFFLYTEKYALLYKHLFMDQQKKTGELAEAATFYQTVYVSSGLSSYLKEFFVLCVLHYYDRFGEERLLHFCLWLDYLLGSYRLKQDSIVARTPFKIIRDQKSNLLDVIQSAYESDEVINFVKSITISSDYSTPVGGKGVRADYVRAVQEYYKKKDAITEKKKWIYEKCRAK